MIMDPVLTQYEAYPYPARNPADENKRLVTGSPSDPAEIEHFGFRGCRDWSTPLSVLVAGGGTGDALVMLAQKLADSRLAHEITYLDLSMASRKVAEARIAARGLESVRFVQGSLLDAGELGTFDYIDCCGVLHHLPDPQAGFDALAAALSPDGVLGAMVYAPLGRSGVYPLQAALRAMTGDKPPAAKVAIARQIIDGLPESHPFKTNTILGDHERGDAGLYDLLLHARDQPFTAAQVIDAVEAAGLHFASFLAPARYDPATWASGAMTPTGLDRSAAADLAEQLCGAMKSHVFYATRHRVKPVTPSPDSVPRMRSLVPGRLAEQVARGKTMTLTRDGTRVPLVLPKNAAPIIRLLDGRRNLGAIAKSLRLDWLAFASTYHGIHKTLTGHGVLLYSRHFP